MQTLSGHFHIGGKAAKLLLAVIIGGLTVSSFVPKDWEVVRTVGQLLMMFSSGMLVSQHAAIWESEAKKPLHRRLQEQSRATRTSPRGRAPHDGQAGFLSYFRARVGL